MKKLQFSQIRTVKSMLFGTVLEGYHIMPVHFTSTFYHGPQQKKAFSGMTTVRTVPEISRM